MLLRRKVLVVMLFLWLLAFILTCTLFPNTNDGMGITGSLPAVRREFVAVRDGEVDNGVGIAEALPMGRREFDLREFGAVGDGEADDTEAFEAAVTEIERRGGGRLRVGSGIWVTRPFNLTSHMTLFLDEKAVILGVKDEQKWPLLPPLPSYGQGRERAGPRYGSLIHGQNLKNVVITGNNGTIDGQGQVWWENFKNGGLNYTRGPLVQFMWSRDVVISNITLRNSPFWTFHPYDCENVTVSNVTILNPLLGAPNTDGIDPDSCKNVLIENCYIQVGDDGIAIKSGFDQYGIEYGRPSTNILIRNVTVRTAVSSGVSIGSEMSGGVSNVVVENSRFLSSRRAIRIKTAPGRGGYIHNITYRNLIVEDCLLGIEIMTNYIEHADQGFDPKATPTVEKLTFTGIHGKEVRVPVQIHGSREIPIKKVSFRDISVKLHRTKFSPFQCAFVWGRVFGPIFPEPCENLDRYDEKGKLVMRSTSRKASNIEYVH